MFVSLYEKYKSQCSFLEDLNFRQVEFTRNGKIAYILYMRSRVFGGTKYLSFARIPYVLLIFTAMFSIRYFQLRLRSIRTEQNPFSGTSLWSEFKSTQTCMCIKNVRKKGIHLMTLQRMFLLPQREYGYPTHWFDITFLSHSESTLSLSHPQNGKNTNKYTRNSTQSVN